MPAGEEYIVEKIFDTVNFNQNSLLNNEYSGCVFKSCDFTDTTLTNVQFFECEFVHCNFTMTKFHKTGFKDCTFRGSKLVGINFGECNKFMFSADYYECVINFCFFDNNNIKETIFENCIIEETTFNNSDLSEVIFENCDLDNSVFERCNLTKTDFVSSRNYVFNPDENKIKMTKISVEGAIGLLRRFDLDIV